MKLSHCAQTLLLCSVIVGLLAPSAWPQASTATVSGTLRDQTGGVIPAASVTLTNSATNVISKTTTNQVGIYFFPGVVPGPYDLVVEALGMQKFEGKLTVQVQQSAVVDAVLRVGQTATEVQVTDVTPLLTVDNPTLSHVLERQRIDQLPINGRFITALLQTMPGMEEESEYDSVSSRGFGMRRGSTEFVLDGASTTDRLMGGVFRRPAGLDTIQEFKVENNVSSAKLGRPTTVIMSTKSGTNQLHGSAFETARNNGVGVARSRTDFYTKPPELVRNEFGASAGGPVYLPKVYNGKNRTFWFFAYEALRDMEATTVGYGLPTVAMRNGDFRGLVDADGVPYDVYDPYTTNPQTWARQRISYNGQLNVIDPARLSPLTKYLFGITPLPTLSAVNPLVAPNFYGPEPNRRRDWTISTRIDHRFTDKDQFYGRYTQGSYALFQNFYSFTALNNVAGAVNRTAPNKAMALSWVHTFSPTFFNEVLVSGSSETWFSGTGAPGVKYADQLGLPNPSNVAGWPALYYLGSMGDWYFETENTQRTPFVYWIADDNATKIMGKHELQFGFHYRHDKLDTTPEQQYVAGEAEGNSNFTALYDPTSDPTNPQAIPYTGDATPGTYMGLLNYWVQLGHPTFQMRSKEYALYFQDNWKVTPRLTLNLGLRYDYWPPYNDVNNLQTSFDPTKSAIVLGTDLNTMIQLGATTTSVVQRLQSLGAQFISYQDAGMPKTLYNTTKTDFGPRAGFAYRLGGGNRAMVLRGGYRISHFTIPLRAWSASERSNAPFYGRFTSSQDSSALSPDGIANYSLRSVPTIVAGVNSQNALSLSNAYSLTYGSANEYYFAPTIPSTRVQDWNMTFEREIMRDTVLRASYVGNHTANLEQMNSFNDATPTYIWYVTTGQPLPTGTYANVARRPYGSTAPVYGTLQEYVTSGWSNFNGISLEAERRYSHGYAFQFSYTMGNALQAGGAQWRQSVYSLNSFLPGTVPADYDARNRFLNYRRDTDVPKHRLKWNWIVDLPFGKGKPLGRTASGVLDKFIGGWQLAGIGSMRSTYFALWNQNSYTTEDPNALFPTGTPVEVYGYKYPIQNCTSGVCYPGYLWWNGYIPANLINSHDANGNPNGIEGVPANYKPAAQPLWPWPANPSPSDPLYRYYGTNTVWVPLSNGTVQRATFSNGLPPLRNQYLPGPWQFGLDASLFKTIPVKERYRIRFNADFFNVLNHPGNCSGASSAAATGNYSSCIGLNGILSTVTSAQPPRVLQLTLRLTY